MMEEYEDCFGGVGTGCFGLDGAAPFRIQRRQRKPCRGF